MHANVYQKHKIMYAGKYKDEIEAIKASVIKIFFSY